MYLGSSDLFGRTKCSKNEGKIILSCYNMDKATNNINSPIKDINQFDTFRVDARSIVLVNYLKKD